MVEAALLSKPKALCIVPQQEFSVLGERQAWPGGATMGVREGNSGTAAVRGGLLEEEAGMCWALKDDKGVLVGPANRLQEQAPGE